MDLIYMITTGLETTIPISSYAFVEFEDDRDARDAFNEMREARFEGYRLNVQFAKNTPSASWRYEPGGRGNSGGGDHSKSQSRGGRSPTRRRSPRRRSGSPAGGRGQHRRPRSPALEQVRRRDSASRSPVRGRSRDRSGNDISVDTGISSPKVQSADKNGRDHAEAHRDIHSRSPSPRPRSPSPRPRSLSPRPRSISPRARSVTP
ncbi:hypothetical protein BGZ49_010067 [Haplosporangium sp. Z 27]|nr:hypothetical protein BGZ49_010067 [Haplosporangium sp. Z 27]